MEIKEEMEHHDFDLDKLVEEVEEIQEELLWPWKHFQKKENNQ